MINDNPDIREALSFERTLVVLRHGSAPPD
jgi:hypothetical protein